MRTTSVTRHLSVDAGNPLSLYLDFRRESLSPIIGRGAIAFTRSSAGQYRDTSGAWQSSTNDVARFDHDPVTFAARGLMIEQNNGNLFLNNTAPVTQTITVTGGQSYTIWLEGAGNITVIAGTAVGSGFSTCTAGNPVFLAITVTGTIILTLSGAVTLAQCENGVYQTSPIATAGVSVARQQDNAVINDITGFFNPVEGTLYAEAYPAVCNSNSSQAVFGFDDGTANNRLYFGRSNTRKLRGVVTVSGSNTLVLDTTATWSDNTLGRIALAYKAGNYALSINGSDVVTQLSGAMPTTLSKAALGTLPSSSTFFNGCIMRLMVYKKRMSNAEIKKLTSGIA